MRQVHLWPEKGLQVDLLAIFVFLRAPQGAIKSVMDLIMALLYGP